jgi:hypothetical protein|tara:strand:- start:57 stop:647 length:591 start_codon:yes stop_codon:yes gene_type:complete
MGIISRTGDLFYAFRFLKLLVTPFEKTQAFELGIIDKEGKILKKAIDRTTPDEKSAYTVFHRLVFNLKRIMAKAPGGKSVVARYGAALFLIKEHTGMSDSKLLKTLEKALDTPFENELNENYWYQDTEARLMPGNYILTEDMASPITGELIAKRNERIIVDDFKSPIGSISNINIYRVKHSKTNQDIYISNRDISR